MKKRADHEPGYVLHTYPYKETSLIVEAFTRGHGRVALLARGARRPRSAMRGVLLSFHPLRLGWSGSAELSNLRAAAARRGTCAARPRGRDGERQRARGTVHRRLAPERRARAGAAGRAWDHRPAVTRAAILHPGGSDDSASAVSEADGVVNTVV